MFQSGSQQKSFWLKVPTTDGSIISQAVFFFSKGIFLIRAGILFGAFSNKTPPAPTKLIVGFFEKLIQISFVPIYTSHVLYILVSASPSWPDSANVKKMNVPTATAATTPQQQRQQTTNNDSSSNHNNIWPRHERPPQSSQPRQESQQPN